MVKEASDELHDNVDGEKGDRYDLVPHRNRDLKRQRERDLACLILKLRLKRREVGWGSYFKILNYLPFFEAQNARVADEFSAVKMRKKRQKGSLGNQHQPPHPPIHRAGALGEN